MFRAASPPSPHQRARLFLVPVNAVLRALHTGSSAARPLPGQPCSDTVSPPVGSVSPCQGGRVHSTCPADPQPVAPEEAQCCRRSPRRAAPHLRWAEVCPSGSVEVPAMCTGLGAVPCRARRCGQGCLSPLSAVFQLPQPLAEGPLSSGLISLLSCGVAASCRADGE